MAVLVDAQLLLRYLSALEQELSGVGIANFLRDEVGPYLQERARKRFEAEGDDVSGMWEPLMPSTQAIRAANPEWPVGPDHPINKRTGELEAWVTRSAWGVSGTPGQAVLQYPATPPTGELMQKVQTAQKGRTTTPRTVPRPVLGVNQTDLLFISTRLAFHLASVGPKI